MPHSELPQRVKGGYVRAARGARQRLRAAHLVPEQAPPVERRVAHWAYSLQYIYDTEGLATLDVPWWTYSAIATVERWLAQRPHPIRVFEYGSGASSLWLKRRVDELHSVEHDRGFADVVGAELTAAGIDFLVREPVPSATPVVASGKSGYHDKDFADYVAAIDTTEGEFDLICIDGRARVACLQAALPRLRPDGLIVFDNTARRRYRPGIAASGLRERRFRGLTPSLPYPECTSLLDHG